MAGPVLSSGLGISSLRASRLGRDRERRTNRPADTKSLGVFSNTFWWGPYWGSVYFQPGPDKGQTWIQNLFLKPAPIRAKSGTQTRAK